VLELEQVGVAILDDHGGAREACHVGDRVGELSVDESANEIVETLALNDGDDLVVVGDAVVAGGQGAALGVGLLLGELVGVALACIDEDREVRELGGSAAGDADPGSGLAGRARGLPEDPFAAALGCG